MRFRPFEELPSSRVADEGEAMVLHDLHEAAGVDGLAGIQDDGENVEAANHLRPPGKRLFLRAVDRVLNDSQAVEAVEGRLVEASHDPLIDHRARVERVLCGYYLDLAARHAPREIGNGFR